MTPYYEDTAAGITIYHGRAEEVLPAVAVGPADLVLTDLPYGEVNRTDPPRRTPGMRVLHKRDADTPTLTVAQIVALLHPLAPSVYLWCGIEQVSELRQRLVQAGFSTRLGIWEKTDPSPMNGEHLWLSSLECCVFARRPRAYFAAFCASPVWRGPVARRQQHPTQKPRWLLGRLIAASCPSGGLVLDPFLGSGTTAVAAKLLGRRCLGVEVNEAYCEVAAQRLSQGVLPLEAV